MGWAIKRADGTYRCWNAHTQDDALHPGEVWEAHVDSPEITAPPQPPTPEQAVLTALVQDALARGVLTDVQAAAVTPARDVK